jgi:lysophospholipase L1-like esterase
MIKKNIFFFGDSITYGQVISAEKTWVHKLGKYINDNFNDQYIIQNSSVLGNTTRDALNRIYQDILFRNPSIVYVQFGMNDCNKWETEKGLCRVMPKTFESNLDEIIQRIRSYNSKVILGTNHYASKSADYDIRNKDYNQIIRTVASSNNIPLIDHAINCETVNYLDLILEDGIHLSEVGHELYYETFIKNINYII